jgi:hypothetical protein
LSGRAKDGCSSFVGPLCRAISHAARSGSLPDKGSSPARDVRAAVYRFTYSSSIHSRAKPRSADGGTPRGVGGGASEGGNSSGCPEVMASLNECHESAVSMSRKPSSKTCPASGVLFRDKSDETSAQCRPVALRRRDRLRLLLSWPPCQTAIRLRINLGQHGSWLIMRHFSDGLAQPLASAWKESQHDSISFEAKKAPDR